jgi:hypothetical protein
MNGTIKLSQLAELPKVLAEIQAKEIAKRQAIGRAVGLHLAEIIQVILTKLDELELDLESGVGNLFVRYFGRDYTEEAIVIDSDYRVETGAAGGEFAGFTLLDEERLLGAEVFTQLNSALPGLLAQRYPDGTVTCHRFSDTQINIAARIPGHLMSEVHKSLGIKSEELGKDLPEKSDAEIAGINERAHAHARRSVKAAQKRKPKKRSAKRR